MAIGVSGDLVDEFDELVGWGMFTSKGHLFGMSLFCICCWSLKRIPFSRVLETEDRRAIGL